MLGCARNIESVQEISKVVASLCILKCAKNKSLSYGCWKLLDHCAMLLICARMERKLSCGYPVSLMEEKGEERREWGGTGERGEGGREKQAENQEDNGKQQGVIRGYPSRVRVAAGNKK